MDKANKLAQMVTPTAKRMQDDLSVTDEAATSALWEIVTAYQWTVSAWLNKKVRFLFFFLAGCLPGIYLAFALNAYSTTKLSSFPLSGERFSELADFILVLFSQEGCTVNQGRVRKGTTGFLARGSFGGSHWQL